MLKKQVQSGVKWTVLNQFGAQIITLFSGAIIARLILPEIFGIVGMLTIITGFLKVITSFGIGNAIIRSKNVSKEYLFPL